MKIERDNQIWDWQFRDINEILYLQEKKTIFHIMRYIQKRQNDLYIYIYENEDWERDKQIWDWQFHDINEILYRQKKKTIILIMRYIRTRTNDIYLYKWKKKTERERIKSEIGNFMILMKYYIAKRRRRYFTSWDTSKAEVRIYIQMKRERETINTEIGNFMTSMKYYIFKKKKTIFRDIRYIKIKINDIYI